MEKTKKKKQSNEKYWCLQMYNELYLSSKSGTPFLHVEYLNFQVHLDASCLLRLLSGNKVSIIPVSPRAKLCTQQGGKAHIKFTRLPIIRKNLIKDYFLDLYIWCLDSCLC